MPAGGFSLNVLLNVSSSENVFQLGGWIVTKPSPSTFKTAVKMEVKAFKSMIENYIFLSNAGF